MNVYIMVGIPGCGKSTYINKNKIFSEIVISSDSIREELTGDITNQLFNRQVFQEYENRLVECLKQNKSCWMDSTAITKQLREKIIDLIIKYNKSAIVKFIEFKPNLNVSLKQNSKRARKVPNEVIYSMFGRFERVKKSELKNLHGEILIIK